MQKTVKVNDEYLGRLRNFNIEALQEQLKEIEADEIELKRAPNAGDFIIEKDEKHTALGYSSTRMLDRDMEIIVPGGIDTSQYVAAGQPKLFNHNWNGLPIGKNLFMKSDGYGLAAKTQYGPIEEYDFAREVFSVIKFGSLRTSSIGFIPMQVLTQGTKNFNLFVDQAIKKWDEFTAKMADNTSAIITKSMLLEDSIVGVPANPAAITVAVSEKSLDVTVKSLEKMGFDVSTETLDEFNNQFKGLFDESDRLIGAEKHFVSDAGLFVGNGVNISTEGVISPKSVDIDEKTGNSTEKLPDKVPGLEKAIVISVPNHVKQAKDYSKADIDRCIEKVLYLKSGKV
jgi:phage head maturation protease